MPVCVLSACAATVSAVIDCTAHRMGHLIFPCGDCVRYDRVCCDVCAAVAGIIRLALALGMVLLLTQTDAPKTPPRKQQHRTFFFCSPFGIALPCCCSTTAPLVPLTCRPLTTNPPPTHHPPSRSTTLHPRTPFFVPPTYHPLTTVVPPSPGARANVLGIWGCRRRARSRSV